MRYSLPHFFKARIMNYFIIIISSLLSLAWLLPNHYEPWITSHSDFCAFIAFIFIIAITIYSVEIIKIPIINLFLLLIMSIPFLQYITGIIFFLGDAFIAAIYIFGFFCAVISGYNLSQQGKNNPKIYLILTSIILLASSISVFIALIQWTLQSNGQVWFADFPSNARPFANFAQPNTLATFLIMGIISLLYLFEKQKLNSISSSLIGLILIFGIALTQSRTSWVFMLCFIIWWLWKTTTLPTRINRKYLGLFVGFYILFVLTLPVVSKFIGLSNTTDVLTRASTGLERVAMWHQMLIAIQHQPWFGYGWNQVSLAQVLTTLDFPVRGWTEHTHNFILDLLVWNGIPIGVAIIVFLIFYLYQLYQLANNIETIIALSMIGAVLIHAMFEYPLDYAFFLLPVGFIIGLIQAQHKDTVTKELSRPYTGSILIILIILYIWIFIEYRIIEEDTQLARFEVLNIGKLHAQKAAPNVVFLTQLREKNRLMRTQPKQNMSDKQLLWLRQIAYRYPTAPALLRYAQALALNHQLVQAKEQLMLIEYLHGLKLSDAVLYEVNESLSFAWENKRKI
ncbi:O-antigen ligase C-terminal domain-containing protein [Acinetobacter radioresistens]